MRVLVVEDEQPIREVICAYLKRAGYQVVEAADGAQAIELFPAHKFNLVILDLNLPKVDGLAVCKHIREKSTVPIIMLTARVEELDEVVGLECGADDYLKKPFSANILLARVQALLRRMGDSAISINGLEINPQKMSVQNHGQQVKLTTTQFNILYLLARNQGRVYTREEILERVSPQYLESDVLQRTVDAHIKSIRKALEPDAQNPQYIVTIIGKGYKFNSEDI